MNEDLHTSRPRRSIFPWVLVAFVAVAAAGGIFWTNQRIEALQATQNASRQEPNLDAIRQAIAALQKTTDEVRGTQQKLSEQVTDLERRFAAEQGERKLLADQLGSISGRVDALASSKAEANPPTSPAQQKNRRSK
ncbi:hypothetical protein [Bradyrhizobium sp. BR 10289]|uniref:hypothetical protein n=1 Tax=Bradyrhizobium sp. BR 10289 TaxID=2749993 RepID=UPI001C650B5E|nr:hypothetical protein [Bradyrhizobium sp. BR 10289]MBW7970103.1 hypothetical protein [Bradyrhizobium sp. BR 10289]